MSRTDQWMIASMSSTVILVCVCSGGIANVSWQRKKRIAHERRIHLSRLRVYGPRGYAVVRLADCGPELGHGVEISVFLTDERERDLKCSLDDDDKVWQVADTLYELLTGEKATWGEHHDSSVSIHDWLEMLG
jgi:hypothetical protein